MKRLGLVFALLASVAPVTLLSSPAHAQSCDPPRILFVMDASSSMLQTIDNNGTTETKWKAVQDAVGSVFSNYGGAAEYGLMTFPGPAGTCSTGTVLVDVGAGTGTQIQNTLFGLNIPANNQTPAGQSLVAASQYSGITDSTRKNYVVFMTDGWQFCDIPTSGAPVCASNADCTLMGVSSCPTCNSCQVGTSDPSCSGQNADGCYCVRNWPTLGVTALQQTQVPTYVVGFGTKTDALTLNKAAQAGGTALAGCDPNSNSPSCYLQATSPSELTTALKNIVQAVVTDSCTGPCGIQGTRTCTGSGWSACNAPSTQSCTNSCGAGQQRCENGQLTPCDAVCPDGGTAGAGGSGGNGGTAGTAGTGATGGSGGAAASGGQGGAVDDAGTGTDAGTAGSGNGRPQDSGDKGGCACRLGAGSQAPAGGSGALAALALGAAFAFRRRRRKISR